ncbi:MAG: pentapeptide repeat-containing protein [Stenomitos frigidus ULC029]
MADNETLVDTDALDLEAAIEQVVNGDSDDFFELAAILGLNPLTDFVGSDLHGITLKPGSDLSGANLRSTNLTLAHLKGANLNGANLSEARLSYANLNGANLSGANLGGVSFKGADLWFANLSYANLSRADLKGADLSGVIVEGTRFKATEGIDRAMQRELMERGAIFEDSPGDHSDISTRR